MALADYDAYLAALKENRVADFQTSGTNSRVQRLQAMWPGFVPAPTVPTTSVSRDKDSAESIGPIPAVGSGRLTILGGRMNTAGAAGVCLLMVDLLNVNGGLSGVATGAQTTNLPTAALTRHTSGEGVFIGLIVHVSIGGTATTVTASYTNQAGTPGRISTATQFGGSNYNAARSIIPLPLAAGDTGVQSVESVTLAATTGTTGNFGVCLFKPVCMMPLNDVLGAMPVDAVSFGGLTPSLAEVHPDACLTVMQIANVGQLVSGAIILAEV